MLTQTRYHSRPTFCGPAVARGKRRVVLVRAVADVAQLQAAKTDIAELITVKCDCERV